MTFPSGARPEHTTWPPHVAAYRAVMWQTGSPVPPWQPAWTHQRRVAEFGCSSKQGIERETHQSVARRVRVTPGDEGTSAGRFLGTYLPGGCKCERLARLVASLSRPRVARLSVALSRYCGETSYNSFGAGSVRSWSTICLILPGKERSSSLPRKTSLL